MSNKNIQYDSLTDSIANVMRERILKGEYKIGEKIKETHVADELRVSRTPIRKAFKQLEEEGLVEYVPNRGCFAKGFTRRDIEDIYAIRKALEELTAEWAASRITESDIAQMKEKCDEMQTYVDKGDSAHVLSGNKEFHEIIYGATGSRFMSQVLRSYKEYIEQTTRPIFYEPKFLQQIVDEHRAIVEGFEQHDQEKAVAAMSSMALPSQYLRVSRIFSLSSGVIS